MNVLGYNLVKVNCSSSEQYNVFNSNNEKIGYLRLKDNVFTATVPAVGGENIYNTKTKGVNFFSEDERTLHLENAVTSVKDWWSKLLSKTVNL